MTVKETIFAVTRKLGWPDADVSIDETPLGSTNLSCAVKYGGKDYVIRAATDRSDVLSINRRAEYAALKEMSELGRSAPLVYFDPESGDMATERLKGRELTGEDYGNDSMAEKVLELLRLMHSRKTDFVFDPYADVEKRLAYLRDNGVGLHPAFGTVYGTYAKLRERNPLTGSPYIGLCHGDPFANNFFLSDSGRLYALDYEFSGMCDVFYDLASAFGWCPADRMRNLLAFYFGSCTDAMVRRLEDFTFIQIMWNCTWSYVKSCEETLNGSDYLEGGHNHVRLLLERLGNYDI